MAQPKNEGEEGWLAFDGLHSNLLSNSILWLALDGLRCVGTRAWREIAYEAGPIINRRRILSIFFDRVSSGHPFLHPLGIWIGWSSAGGFLSIISGSFGLVLVAYFFSTP